MSICFAYVTAGNMAQIGSFLPEPQVEVPGRECSRGDTAGQDQCRMILRDDSAERVPGVVPIGTERIAHPQPYQVPDGGACKRQHRYAKDIEPGDPPGDGNHRSESGKKTIHQYKRITIVFEPNFCLVDTFGFKQPDVPFYEKASAEDSTKRIKGHEAGKTANGGGDKHP